MFLPWKHAWKLLCLVALLGWLGQTEVRGEDFLANCLGGCCPKFHCPPRLQHCLEGAPRLHFRCGCPRPICNPCNLPNWGYYQACWNPWPWQHNWSHCPVPPPAALVHPGLPPVDNHPGQGRPVPDPSTIMPTPRPVERPGL